MYFSGKTKCFMCEREVWLSASVGSEWRAIKAETKMYYFCTDCQPKNKEIVTVAQWQMFYQEVLSKICETDFKRPIRSLLLLRDVGGNPQIIQIVN